MIKLSIIIPCYNCESTVTDTVKSIEDNSDFNLTEIILINDGSTDSTLKVINLLKEKYLNIVVIDKKNSGVSETRNMGINKASGEYICFVDSDDFVCNNIFKKVIKLISKKDIDIICFEFMESVNGKQYKSKYHYNNELIDNEKGIKMFLLNKVSIAVWDKIYKKSILKDVKFNKKYAVGEDTLFCYDSLVKSNKTYLMNEIGYIYIQREGSAVHKVSDKILGVNYVANEIKISNSNFADEYDFFCCYSMMRAINTLSYLYNKTNKKIVVDLICQVYDKNKLKKLSKCEYSPKSLKIESFILRKFGVKFHLFIFKFYDLVKRIISKGGK